MAQFSVKIMRLTGSVLGENQHHGRKTFILETLGPQCILPEGHGEVHGQNRRTHLGEDRPEVPYRPQAAEGADGGTDDQNKLALKRLQWRLPVHRARTPVERVLQERRDRSVMLGAGDQKAGVPSDRCARIRNRRVHIVTFLEIAVVDGKGVVAQRDPRHGSALSLCLCRDDAEQGGIQ